MSWLGKHKQTEHRHFEEQLSAYLDGELLPREQEAVEQHLATCPSCRWNLNTQRQTVQWTSELPMVRVPRTFTIPVPAQPARAARRWRLLPALQGATALVALLLFFVIAGDVMLTGFQPVGMHEAEPQTLAVEMTVPAEAGAPAEAEALAEAGVPIETVVEMVVVEKQAESLMMQEAPAAEESAATQELDVLAGAPAEAATVTAEAEMRATMAPAGMGGGVEGMEEETVPAPEGDTRAPAVPPTSTVLPTLEPAPTRAAMPPPSAPVEVGEALSVPTTLLESEKSYDTRPATLTWVRWGEYVLGVLLILLVGTTIGAMVWRRSRG